MASSNTMLLTSTSRIDTTSAVQNRPGCQPWRRTVCQNPSDQRLTWRAYSLSVVGSCVSAIARLGLNAMRPSLWACTSNVMLKSSIDSPGAAMSTLSRMSVRYMLAKPGTIVTELAVVAAWPYFWMYCVSTYMRSR